MQNRYAPETCRIAEDSWSIIWNLSGDREMKGLGIRDVQILVAECVKAKIIAMHKIIIPSSSYRD